MSWAACGKTYIPWIAQVTKPAAVSADEAVSGTPPRLNRTGFASDQPRPQPIAGDLACNRGGGMNLALHVPDTIGFSSFGDTDVCRDRSQTTS